MANIRKWVTVNEIILNIEKINYVIYHRKQTNQTCLLFYNHVDIHTDFHLDENYNII